MPTTVFVLPVLEGQVGRLRAFAATLQGERRGEFEASQRRLGVTREAWYVRETPEAATAAVYVEAEDVAQALQRLVMSQDPADLWMKSEVAAVTGIDFNRPPAGAPFETILSYGYG